MYDGIDSRRFFLYIFNSIISYQSCFFNYDFIKITLKTQVILAFFCTFSGFCGVNVLEYIGQKWYNNNIFVFVVF